MTDTRSTVLRDRHDALGASFTDFGGWMMPVRYTSELAEHRAVREAAGLFDVSHMAEFEVDGPEAGDLLDGAFAGRLSTMRLLQAKYSLLLTDTGGIIDDVIVYRLGDERFLIVANAGNHDAVAETLQDRAEGWDADVRDVSDDFALLALQGPRAVEILTAVDGIADLGTGLDKLRNYTAAPASFHDAPLLVARTGYTGEDGFELLVPAEDGAALWDAVLAAGADHGLVPAGLAARDTLRLEAGMPLYGNELTRETLPRQAGLGRVVAADKERFVGKDALAADAPADEPVLVGLTGEGRRAGRSGYAVVDADGVEVGRVTSGALSPTLGHPIAMAYVHPRAAEPGTVLAIDVRGTPLSATVTALPFYRRKK